MSDADKKIAEMRKAMADMKEDCYAIVNKDFQRLDEFKQNLYLKVLCTLIQYENEPSAMQLLFFARLLKGAEKKEPVEDYMRQALDLSADNIREFVKFIREDICRYYFALEAIMLVTMEKSSRGRYEYLAELLELIGITKPEVDYLSSVAKSVLMQDTSFLNKAHLELSPKLSEAIKKVSSLPYHYEGVCIEDNDEILSISAQSIINYNIENNILKNKKKIILKNLNVYLTCNLDFEGCEEVILQDCVFKSKDFTMNFAKINSLNISNCVFQDFIMQPFYAVDNIKICYNTFERCKCVSKSDLNLRSYDNALRVAGLFTVKCAVEEYVTKEEVFDIGGLVGLFLGGGGSIAKKTFRDKINYKPIFCKNINIENNEFSRCICEQGLLSRLQQKEDCSGEFKICFDVTIKENIFIASKYDSGDPLYLESNDFRYSRFCSEGGAPFERNCDNRFPNVYGITNRCDSDSKNFHFEDNFCMSGRSGASRRLDC